MRMSFSRTFSDRSGGLGPVIWLMAALAAPGCSHEPEIDFPASKTPTVRLIVPPVREIVRVVGQPSFIESYEPRRSSTSRPLTSRTGLSTSATRSIKSTCSRRSSRLSGSKNSVRRRQPSCSTRSESHWPRRSSRWRMPRSRRRRLGSRRPRRSWTSTRPRSSAGTRRSAAPAPGQSGRGQCRGPFRVDQPAQVEHRGAGQGRRRRSSGPGPNYSPPAPGSPRLRWMSGSPWPL